MVIGDSGVARPLQPSIPLTDEYVASMMVLPGYDRALTTYLRDPVAGGTLIQVPGRVLQPCRSADFARHSQLTGCRDAYSHQLGIARLQLFICIRMAVQALPIQRCSRNALDEIQSSLALKQFSGGNYSFTPPPKHLRNFSARPCHGCCSILPYLG
ncbi:hypothetical protein LY76DRAFT_331212 [Colletotrichum caudatum]|nr:hypothetical protein LY76DRAFT_331212 [Colletotrichum caudatum]